MGHGWSTRVHEGRRHEGVGHKDSTFQKKGEYESVGDEGGTVQNYY